MAFWDALLRINTSMPPMNSWTSHVLLWKTASKDFTWNSMWLAPGIMKHCQLFIVVHINSYVFIGLLTVVNTPHTMYHHVLVKHNKRLVFFFPFSAERRVYQRSQSILFLFKMAMDQWSRPQITCLGMFRGMVIYSPICMFTSVHQGYMVWTCLDPSPNWSNQLCHAQDFCLWTDLGRGPSAFAGHVPATVASHVHVLLCSPEQLGMLWMWMLWIVIVCAESVRTPVCALLFVNVSRR